MFTIQQALGVTPATVRNAAKTVHVVPHIALSKRDFRGWFDEFVFKAWGDSIMRQVVIRTYGKGALRQVPIWVHCSCEWFVYNCEVALTMGGSSTIVDSNGAYPTTTNPNLLPFVCKHVVACIGKIKTMNPIQATQEQIDHPESYMPLKIVEAPVIARTITPATNRMMPSQAHTVGLQKDQLQDMFKKQTQKDRLVLHRRQR